MQTLLLLCLAALAFANEDVERSTCLQEPDEGMCRGYFEMYYYDYTSRSCRTFVYGGCGGNGNIFGSESECMERCGDVIVFDSESDDKSACEQPREPGMCMAYIPRYYYNKESNQCEKFIYGGCQANANNFRSQKECEERCVRKESAAPSLCHEDKVVGTCRGRFLRYYFNKEEGRCMPFFYGGCNGNENNFLSHEECESVCSD